MGTINMPIVKDSLFIQYKLNEHRMSLLDGNIRLTQQQYYRNISGEVSDSLEGEQLISANEGQYKLLGNHSTYIWSCSVIDGKQLYEIKKFTGYDFGLLILEPEAFKAQVYECLNNTPLLREYAEIKFDRVTYTDKEYPMPENKNKPLSRWTKPQCFKDECEYRLCAHNVPTFEFIEQFHRTELHRVEKLYTPNEKVNHKETSYRLVFNVAFDFDYKLYFFNGKDWCEE